MIRIHALALVALTCSLPGCKPSSRHTSSQDSHLPTLREQLGVKPDATPETRVGYLSNMAMQHPSISERDDYLDMYDAAGNWRNQIILVFEKGVDPPQDRTKPVEVKGPVGRIDLGGPESTKDEYANDVVFVESWRQLDQKDVPRKEGDEPEPVDEGLNPVR